jgi:pSer/pThr/pTyr-binding forkhead associated (FHA) protein/cytoskeletal protein RodZ
MSLRLIIEDDEGSTTIVPLGKEAVTIGRQQGNTIQLTEKNVSRRHARLVPDGEIWVLEDLGSYNGVKVNGRAVEGRVSLREGDVVQIGDYHLALTEDVERRSLNYDRPRTAANDVEPMLASSSTNLPRLSPDDLAAMSSGQQAAVPPAPPPMLVDSGQIPMSRPQPTSYPEERQKKGAGVLVAVGLLGIGAVALGGFWIASNSGTTTPTAVASASPEAKRSDAAPPAAKPSEPPTKAEPVVAPEPATPTTPPPPDAVPQPSDANPPPPEPPDDGGVVEVEPDTPTPKPVATKTPDKPAAKKPTPTPKPTPATPATPPVDVAQLLADARKANLQGNSSTAYDLASKAYAASKSQDAAIVMALAACKMGDAGRAKKAVAKLKGSRRDEAIKVCSGKGITIDS